MGCGGGGGGGVGVETLTRPGLFLCNTLHFAVLLSILMGTGKLLFRKPVPQTVFTAMNCLRLHLMPLLAGAT